MERWYRIVASGSRMELELVTLEYEVRRATPKGVWITLGSGVPDRFVRLDAKRRFACPTLEEARQSFAARKKRQIQILSAQLENAKRALALVERP